MYLYPPIIYSTENAETIKNGRYLFWYLLTYWWPNLMCALRTNRFEIRLYRQFIRNRIVKLYSTPTEANYEIFIYIYLKKRNQSGSSSRKLITFVHAAQGGCHAILSNSAKPLLQMESLYGLVEYWSDFSVFHWTLILFKTSNCIGSDTDLRKSIHPSVSPSGCSQLPTVLDFYRTCWWQDKKCCNC